MARVAPFKGVRFNPDQIGNLEEVVTPPYDVISEEDGDRFLEKNPYNMIRLDLRNTSQETGNDEERYSRAKTLFEEWQKKGVLIRDEQPAMYLYYIDYIHPSGRRMTRKGLICLVELVDFAKGIVKPHEKTFDAVIVDRLRLMRTCRAQFSKVFSIYNDPSRVVISGLEKARESQPLCSISDHMGSTHTLWRVTDPAALEDAACYFKDKPLYIADGHHRYTTALACREEELKENPSLPAASPYNFIMMYLCATEDPGLSVLPTHRLLSYPDRLTADDCIRKMLAGLEVEEIFGASREALVAEILGRMDECRMASGRPVFGLYHAREDRCFLLSPKSPLADYPSLAAKPDVLRDLDVVVLSDLLFQELLGLDHKKILEEKLVRYFSDPDDALDIAVKTSITDDGSTPLLFLLNPTRVVQVTDVADSGEIMPHKSTYFFPKILTGLMINRLDSPEKIELPGSGS